MGRFEEYFASLRGKEILVLGLGVSNRPLVRLLLEFGCSVTGCDRTQRADLDAEVLQLEAAGCRLRLGEDYLDGLRGDVVFRTPGMHPGTPAIAALQASGAQVTSEMEVFFRLCPCTTIGVTGSDGKTTTTSLIAAMLKAAGKKVWLGGNIGTPLLPFCREMKAEDYAVVELSSFQLMDMQSSPHIAVVTNVTPNHLDVHRDMDEYVQAKTNVFRSQKPGDKLILNADNPITDGFAGVGETVKFSLSGKRAACRVEENHILRREKKVLDTGHILIPGAHNVDNYMAAILAVEGLVDDDTIRSVARNFPGVEHRIELVRIKDGVRYYNDSIASSPTRTIAGLRSFYEKVVLIAGGYDKHIPFDALGQEICQRVKRLYLNGATAGKIRAAVENCGMTPPEMIDCEDLASAVRAAAADAQPGDVVLLSPACAAFDQFKNFMVRGNFFKSMIREL